MRNFNGSFLYEFCGPGAKGTKMKNRCSSPECKCSLPVVNVHHYQCPLMNTPCPLHGYPIIYNLKNKKTQPEQCLVISFHPSLKTDKLFEPVKTFLNQTCEPETKINFHYYSPRLSETCCEDFQHRQVQASPEDFKKLGSSCFVEKTKTFFTDKTNKVKKLKQCFNSPCNSDVDKSRSCTAIKEKIEGILREGTGDGCPDKSKLEKRIKAACCMKSELSSHFLYKRDFDLSDGEKSSKEKVDLDPLKNINDSLLDHNGLEIRPRKGLDERAGRLSGNMKPHFMYPSFVSPQPIEKKVHGYTETEEVSDLEKTNEGSQNPDAHSAAPKEDKRRTVLLDGSQSGNISSDSSGSVYFTPFILVPGGNDNEVEDKGIQTATIEPEMVSQWVQTTECSKASVSNQTENPVILVAERNSLKIAETQTSGIFMLEASRPQMTSDAKGNENPFSASVAVQTLDQRRSESMEKIVWEATEPLDVGTQTQETPVTPTVVYYEPEMKFLRRKETPESEKKGVKAEDSRNVAVQTEERTDHKETTTLTLPQPGVTEKTHEIPTIVYYEPEMKFLRRKETPESEKKGVKAEDARNVAVQTEETTDHKKTTSLTSPEPDVTEKTQETPVTSTVVYYEPEMKFLRRKEKPESENKGVKAEDSRNVAVQTEEATDHKKTTTLTLPQPDVTEKAQEIPTIVYYEPEMKFFRRKERPDNEKKGVKAEDCRNVAVQTEETPTITYYEPEMKFLSRGKSSKNVAKVEELKTAEIQTQTTPELVTVIYFEPETKPLRRKDEGGKRAVLFNDETQVKQIGSGKKDQSVGTESETLEESERGIEKYDSAYLGLSQNKETQVISDSDTSQSYFDSSDTSNSTYVVRSYVSEESEQVVVKNWNKSRSEGDMHEKIRCECLEKADHPSPSPYQCADTNPNDLTFVGVYRSKKKTYASSKPKDWTKAQQSKPEGVVKRKEDNKASFADLSDLIRIIDENFKKMFARGIAICDCQKESKPKADKEVLTDISGVNDTDIIFQMATRSMANAQIQATLPILDEMPLTHYSNPDEEPPICNVCSKVISTTTVNVGTNTQDGSYIHTKMQEVDMGTYREDFTIRDLQEASTSKSEPTEKPSTSKGKSGGVKSVRMTTKTFVTKLEKLPESNRNPTPSPTSRRTTTYPEPFSDSTASLRRDLRRAQQECGVIPKSLRPKPSPRSRPTPTSTPTPKPRQTQSPQSRPQVQTRIIPDSFCGNIIATTTTRRTPSARTQESCPFEPQPPLIDYCGCPLPPRPNPDLCDQRNQQSKEPGQKQNYKTYHVTVSSPLWSKDTMRILQRKLKKISKSEFSPTVIGKQKRNHDGGSDGGPTVKKLKSAELERLDCFEFGKSETDMLFKFLTKGENDRVLEEESPQLSKNSGFVWVPSFPAPRLSRMRQVSSAEETAKSKETPKEVNRRHSQVLSKIREEGNRNESSTKNTCRQNLDFTGERNLIRKLFKCSSCKSLTYIQLKKSDVIQKHKNNSSNFKSNPEDIFTNFLFTQKSHSLVESAASSTDSEQKNVETVSSTEAGVPTSGTDNTHKFLHELYYKFLAEKSDSYFAMDVNQVETGCHNSELTLSSSGNAFNVSRSNQFFYDSSPDVSNSKMATKSECLRTYRFCTESSTAIPDSKKTILKNLPSKIFKTSKRKSK